MAERRKAKRVVITAIAEVTSLNDQSVREGYVSNISRGGVGVFVKDPMRPGDQVEVKLSFYTTDGIQDIKQIQGTVRRVEMMANVFHTGIEFKGLDSRKDRDLIAYLKVQKAI